MESEKENNIVQSLEDNSVIKKNELTAKDLKESINKCMINVNNEEENKTELKKNNNDEKLKNLIPQKKIIKPLTNEKEKIIEIKERIIKIFDDNKNIIQNISSTQLKNDNELNKIIMEAQINFENEIDKLYEEKILKLNKIKEQYNIDLFELKKYYEDEIKYLKESEKPILKFIYDSVKEDKEKEIKLIEDDFQKKKKIITDKYKCSSEQKEDFNLDDRSVIYKNELFENLKNKINDVINPIDKQRLTLENHQNNILKGIEG